MERLLHVLHLEDNANDAELVRSALETEGIPCDLVWVSTRNEYETALRQGGIDLILSDHTLPAFDGRSALKLTRAEFPDIPFIFVTGSLGEESAIETIKNGATDYVLKDRLSRLIPAIHRAIAERKEREDRKRAEELLRQSEERFRAFMDNSSIAAFIKDERGRFVYVNRKMQDLFGRNESSLLGKTDFEILPKDLAQQNLINDTQVFSSGRSVESVAKGQTSDGALRYALVSKFLIPDASGRHLLGGVEIDITDRKAAEEQIREQAALLDKAQDAICVTDLDRRVLYWNQSCERLYGWTAAEAVGQRLTNLFFDESDEISRDVIKSLFSRGEWLGELAQTTRERKELIVKSSWTLVHDEDQHPKSVLVINTDVTEKTKLEAQFLRAQRLESIGTLASGIAHDLNNVLAPILMGAEVLRISCSDEQSLRILESMESSAKRGADLVKQVLSFARGFEGGQATVQLRHLVREMEKIVKDTFPKAIQCSTSVPHGLWAITGHAIQFHQVLMNLCVNARDAMPTGGRLRLMAENVVLEPQSPQIPADAKPGPYVVLRVSDTGMGIPAEIQQKIFEPFFTTKEPGKGTGLGLSTTLSIVRNHGGFVLLESEIGKGTDFKIYFPAVTDRDAAEGSEEPRNLPTGSGELVLLVDDDAAVREMSKTTLESYGYRVVLANDGAEAVAMFAERKSQINVVMTDMAMPFLDGPATVRALKKMAPSLKIIGASGLESDTAEAELGLEGLNAFVKKPYSVEDLLTTLRNVLDAA